MPTPSPSYRLPRDAHLRRRREFDRVFQSGIRLSDPCLLVHAGRTALPYARLGLAVSRRLGNAVRRNRHRRRIREAFRLIRQQLPPGIDLVVIPRGSAEPPFEALQQSLLQLARQADRRLPR